MRTDERAAPEVDIRPAHLALQVPIVGCIGVFALVLGIADLARGTLLGLPCVGAGVFALRTLWMRCWTEGDILTNRGYFATAEWPRAEISGFEVRDHPVLGRTRVIAVKLRDGRIAPLNVAHHPWRAAGPTARGEQRLQELCARLDAWRGGGADDGAATRDNGAWSPAPSPAASPTPPAPTSSSTPRDG